MNIVKMIISDYEEAYKLWADTEGMGLRSLDDSYDGIGRFINRNPNTNFICRIDGNLAGVILSGHDGRRGYIYHAVVKTEYRKQGLGKLLVETVIKALKNEGINKVGLVVFSDNNSGNIFWESIGFTKREDLVYRNCAIEVINK